MTRDEIMQIANDTAGAYWMDEAHIQRFAAALLAAERERIKAERQPHLYGNPLYAHGCPVCGIATTAYACSRGDCPTRITCTFL